MKYHLTIKSYKNGDLWTVCDENNQAIYKDDRKTICEDLVDNLNSCSEEECEEMLKHLRELPQ